MTGQPQGEPMRHGSLVSAVAFSPDGKTVATASFDSSARIWDAATGQTRGHSPSASTRSAHPRLQP